MTTPIGQNVSLAALVSLNEKMKRASMAVNVNRNGIELASMSESKEADPSATSKSSGGAFGMMARAAAKLKAKASKASSKSDVFLRMQPPDEDHAPVGLPVREVLIQTFNYRRDRTMFEFLLYVLYVGVFLALVYELNDTQSIESVNSNVFDAFLDEPLVNQDNGGALASDV